MNRQEHEHLAEWDAAYVLGALRPADRRVYEQHMEQCQLCREAVNELSSMPGLLAHIRPEPEVDLPDQPRAPADVVDAVLRTEHRRTTRRRRRLGWAAAAAAVLALVIAIPAALMLQSADDAVSVALEPVDAAPTSMSVEVSLTPTAWGTDLSIECRYPTDMGYQERQTWYALIVTDTAGASTQVSTWRAVAGQTITLDAATAVDLEDIASLTVITASGSEVLTAPIPGP